MGEQAMFSSFNSSSVMNASSGPSAMEPISRTAERPTSCHSSWDHWCRPSLRARRTRALKRAENYFFCNVRLTAKRRKKEEKDDTIHKPETKMEDEKVVYEELKAESQIIQEEEYKAELEAELANSQAESQKIQEEHEVRPEANSNTGFDALVANAIAQDKQAMD